MSFDSVRRQSALVVFVALAGSGAKAQTPNQPAAQPAPSEERAPEVAVWLSRATSDNVGRLDGGQRGSYDGVGVLLDLGYVSRRIESSLNANVEARRYSDDAIDNEPIGSLDGRLNIDVVPDRFRWELQETYGQGQTDAFNAAGPNNRESINVFTTGPQLDVPLGGSTRLSAGARYSTHGYDESDALDNDAKRYELGVFRQAGPATSYGLSVTTNEVEYDAPGAPPYDVDRTSLRYQRSFSTGGISLDVGTNELTFLGTTNDEPLFNFEWNRGLAARSTLRVTAAREFSDSGSTLRADLSQVPAGADARILLSSSPFEQQRLFVAYSLGGTRTDLSIGVGTSEESFVNDASLDNDNTTTQVSLNREVTPRLGFGVNLYRVKREFAAAGPNAARSDSDKTASAWVNRSLGRVFDLAVIFTRYQRGGTESFDEDRYEIRLTYSPSDSATSALGTAGR